MENENKKESSKKLDDEIRKKIMRMNAISEVDIEIYLRKKVEALKGRCVKTPGTYAPGFPDRQVLMPAVGEMIRTIVAKTWHVELKRPGKIIIPGSKQDQWRIWLTENGFNHICLDSFEAVDNFVANELQR